MTESLNSFAILVAPMTSLGDTAH